MMHQGKAGLHGDDSGKLRLLCGMEVTGRFSIFNFAFLCHNIHQNVSSLICCH